MMNGSSSVTVHRMDETGISILEWKQLESYFYQNSNKQGKINTFFCKFERNNNYTLSFIYLLQSNAYIHSSEIVVLKINTHLHCIYITFIQGVVC